MNELKPEDVMRALECCKSPKLTKCDQCPRKDEDALCMYRLCEDALALLCEKDASIEALTMHSEDLEAELSQAYELYKENDAEIERLTAYIQRCKSGEEYWVKCLLERPQEARAEAITEFAKELTSELINGGIYPVFVKGSIERTAKKLKGVPDGETDL